MSTPKIECRDYGVLHERLAEFEVSISDIEVQQVQLKEMIARLRNGEDVRGILIELIQHEVLTVGLVIASDKHERDEMIAHFEQHHGYRRPT